MVWYGQADHPGTSRFATLALGKREPPAALKGNLSDSKFRVWEKPKRHRAPKKNGPQVFNKNQDSHTIHIWMFPKIVVPPNHPF